MSSKETVIIGCKLPAGVILEIGLQTVEKLSVDGRSGFIDRVKKLPNYERIVIKGWNAHTAEARKAGIQVPAGSNMQPFLNRGIRKAAWEEWKKEHADSWLLKNKILFEADDEASAQIQVLEADKTPSILAPLDKDKPTSGISKANFNE